VKAYETALQLRADDADSKFNRDLVKRKIDALNQQQNQNKQNNKDQGQNKISRRTRGKNQINLKTKAPGSRRSSPEANRRRSSPEATAAAER